MATAKITDNIKLVTEFIQKLEPGLGALVEVLRQVILGTDPEIGEQIKWNSPSFYYTGAMKPFDPKEYKRDIVVINLSQGQPLLVFPSGARVNDPSGLLTGHYKDGRRLVKLLDVEEVLAKEIALKTIISNWLKGIDK